MSEIFVAEVREFEAEAQKAGCDLTRRDDDQTYANYPTRFAWQLWQDRARLPVRRVHWLIFLCWCLFSFGMGAAVDQAWLSVPPLRVTFAPPRPPDPIFVPQCLQTVMEMAHCDVGRFVCMHVTPQQKSFPVPPAPPRIVQPRASWVIE